MSTLFLLIGAHALCDYPLQGDFLSRGKNQTAPLPGVPWYQCLFAHAMIHALAVYLITRSLPLALTELACHAAIDYGKSDGLYGFNVDQFLHIACKCAWALIVATAPGFK